MTKTTQYLKKQALNDLSLFGLNPADWTLSAHQPADPTSLVVSHVKDSSLRMVGSLMKKAECLRIADLSLEMSVA